MDFSVIDRAGITQEQFGHLVGVSRVTVNTWVKSHFRPRANLRHRVNKAIELLDAAIAEGKLPLRDVAQQVNDQLDAIRLNLNPEA